MTNNDERREIAAILRGLDERIDGMPLMCTEQEHDAMVLRAIRAVIGKGDIFHLLADLIEPDERTCHMTLKKSGPYYDVWYFDCCEKEWAENRCDNCIVDYPGIVCPWCGAKVVR